MGKDAKSLTHCQLVSYLPHIYVYAQCTSYIESMYLV